MRVALLTGGSTPERDVALAGAAQVVRALRERGHTVTVVDTVTGPLNPTKEQQLLRPAVGTAPPTADELRALARRERPEQLVSLPELRSSDVVFLVLHGQQGEGGEIQALLELTDIPYTGSAPLGSAMAMDKEVAKRLFRDGAVPTPRWHMWPVEPKQVADLGFPLVVKPSRVGSSVGLSVIESPDALGPAVDLARTFDEDVMLEQFVPGREFTVGVLGERALAVGEIIPAHATFDYECKYTPGMTEEVFPAPIPEALASRLQTLALTAHRVLKLRDFSRVDFKVDDRGAPQCLEVNTLPGLTATSLLPQSAAACGIAFGDLCDTICRMANGRGRRKEQSGPLRE